MALLPSMGCTHIVTVQGSREKAEIVGESAKTHGMEWINIPLDNAQPLNYTQIESMLEKLKLICEAIESGGHVLIHCAAGLHRTGMIGNLVLLYMGLSPSVALDKIREARTQTADDVCEHRLQVGQAFVKLCGTRSNPTPLEIIKSEVAQKGDQFLVEPVRRNKAGGKQKRQDTGTIPQKRLRKGGK
eukprot:TRINITY_DN2009_c0_g1_i2.p1 TRINITY_DN2009_c0_g1~~TRINITY_DN2009_c0_g1_i2.p1  ORF type:complete len:187 (-),score=24.00 TRINITY_DN2009_c0_g1_i2:31-591(-)